MYAYANLREEKETEKAILVQDAYTPHMTYIQSPHPLPHNNTIPTYNSPFPPLSPPKAPNTSPPYNPTNQTMAPFPFTLSITSTPSFSPPSPFSDSDVPSGLSKV